MFLRIYVRFLITGNPKTILWPYSIDHAHLTLIFTTSNHLAALLRTAPRHPHLRLIVVIDELEPESKRFATAWAQTMGVKLQELSESMSSFIMYVSY